MRVALHVRRGDVMPVDKGDRGAREGAAWGLPLKAQCKAVELAAYWPCLRAYLESRANETARVVSISPHAVSAGEDAVVTIFGTFFGATASAHVVELGPGNLCEPIAITSGSAHDEHGPA